MRGFPGRRAAEGCGVYGRLLGVGDAPRGRLYIGAGVDWRTGVARSGLAVLPLLPVGWRAMGEEGRGDEGSSGDLRSKRSAYRPEGRLPGIALPPEKLYAARRRPDRVGQVSGQPWS